MRHNTFADKPCAIATNTELSPGQPNKFVLYGNKRNKTLCRSLPCKCNQRTGILLPVPLLSRITGSVPAMGRRNKSNLCIIAVLLHTELT